MACDTSGNPETGVISKNVAPESWALNSGNTYLSEISGYVDCSGDDRPRNRLGHNLANIEQVLSKALGPPETEVSTWSAFEVFVGYLVFDAWIANTDRHALNWGILSRGKEIRLAKSFDHGSALGSGMENHQLKKLLAHEAIESWSGKAKATRFENGHDQSLSDIALLGLAKVPRARLWLERLLAFDQDAIMDLLDGIPTLSGEARIFTSKLLITNRERLCHVN